MQNVFNRIQWLEDQHEKSVMDAPGLNYKIWGVSNQEEDEFFFLKQVHSIKVIEVQSSDNRFAYSYCEGDGLYTFEKNVKIAVKTADCLPIIIASKKGQFIGVVHAGWRGLAAGILSSLIVNAIRYASCEDLVVYLGPCIGPGAFEVGPEVVDHFLKGPGRFSNEEIGYCLHKGVGDRWNFDLATAAIFELLKWNIDPENISVLRSCTFNNPHKWYSYRKLGQATTCNWTVAWLN